MIKLVYLLMGLLLFACVGEEQQTLINDHILVAEINSQPVTSEELRFYMHMEKAKVVDYFFKKHRMEVNQDFWTTDLAGETPIDVLRDSAWRLLRRDYEVKATALTHGIIESTSFGTLLTGLAEENRQREKALRENRIVYGPIEFDLRGYYFHYLSSLQSELKRRGISGLETPLYIVLDTAQFNQVTL